MNIACRNVHMLEFAVSLAKVRQVREVSLFVGEIPNTDMAWYQEYTKERVGVPEWADKELLYIQRDVQAHAQVVHEGKGDLRRPIYAGAMMLGMVPAVLGYTMLVRWLVSLL